MGYMYVKEESLIDKHRYKPKLLFWFQLKERGYHNMDALDAVQRMLDVAKTKDIFKNLICAAVEVDTPMPIEKGEYADQQTATVLQKIILRKKDTKGKQRDTR